MRFFEFILATAGIALLTGCAPSFVALTDSGLAYRDAQVQVDWDKADGINSTFIDENWQIENWETVSTVMTEVTVITRKRKSGDKFRGIVYRDLNDDGTLEKETVFYTDLELRHKSTDAEIFVDLNVLPKSKRDTDIGIFLSRFAENLSGKTSWYKVSVYGQLMTDETTYASKIIQQKKLKIGNHDAILATIERANLDQLKLDSTHRSEILSVLMVKLVDFIKKTTFSNDITTDSGILMIVLTSRPEHHSAVYKDYAKFLDSVKIDGIKIGTIDHTSLAEAQPIIQPTAPANATQEPVASPQIQDEPDSVPSTESDPSGDS